MSRGRERWLLQQVAAIVLLAAAGVVGARVRVGQPPGHPAELAYLLGWVALLAVVHRVLCHMDLLGDEAIVPAAALLTGFGLVLKLRLAEPVLGWQDWRSLLPYPISAATLLVAAWICRRRLHWLEWAAWLCGLLAAGLMVLLVKHGTAFRGAMYGPGLTTPSELLKPLLVIFLAGFLKHRRELPELLSFVVIWVTINALLVKQSDLGMVVILGALLLSMFYVSTGRMRYLLIGLVLAAAIGLALHYAGPLSSAAARGERRITTWLNPWRDPMGAGYQSLQALFAIRAGGWDGMGLGAGYPQLTPLVESDFVWAAVAEELGLLGSAMLLLAYVALYRRGYRIAALADDPFRQRLAVGCVTVLAIQTLLNVGGVVRWVPVTGITLPLLSHGGSSLVVTHALLGLILAVGHEVEAGDRVRGAPAADDEDVRG